MNAIKKFSLLGILLGILYLCCYPIALSPIARAAPPFPGLEGAYAPNYKLSQVTRIAVPSPGPESIVEDSLGNFYTGLSNGDILYFDSTGKQQKKIVNTGGRPLGMKFSPDGDLIIADQKKGLLQWDRSGNLKTLVNQYEGEALLFIDDLDIDSTGVIYFSNATQRNPDIVENEAWEQRASGALFRYFPTTKKVELLKDNLFFANGIALHPSEDYLILSETFGLRLHKYWIKGEKAGTLEVFVNALPGYPDNVTYTAGIFWVAIPSQRALSIEPLFEMPFLRSVILRLPEAIRNAVIPQRYAMLVGYDTEGKVVYNFQDPDGKYDYITSVLQVENKLYLGSLKEPHFALYDMTTSTADAQNK